MSNDTIRGRMPDGGPVYTETDMGHFIVEPWNAVSSLLIVLPAVYWLIVIRKDLRQFGFLLFSIVLIILGGTGSTLFHAFRASRFFLFLDVIPSAILTLSISIFFWIKILNRWWHVLLIILPAYSLRFVIFSILPDDTAINVSYAIAGAVAALPIVIILFRTGFFRYVEVALTIILFSLALVFREVDFASSRYLPMGSHFLWHVFTGFGAYFILSYLYHFRKRELSDDHN